jgi:hypothetical protein
MMEKKLQYLLHGVIRLCSCTTVVVNPVSNRQL